MGSPRARLGFLLTLVIGAGCSTASPSSSTPGGVTSAPPSGATSGSATPSTTGTGTPAVPDPQERTLLFDTDVAGDDLVALSFLVAAPNVHIGAITVSGTGEAHCAGGVDVVLRLLDRLGAPEIPVACGRETPLAGTHSFPDAWRERVDNGSGLTLDPTTRTPSPSSAVDLIIEQSKQHAELVVLATGPLTNLADALGGDPSLADRLGRVYVMGGALHVPGNLVCCGAPEGNAVAEWNIYVDPRAAQIVVDSGVLPSFVSLDGTNQVPLTPTFAERVMQPSESAARGVVAELFAANPFMTDGSFYLWDVLAAELAAGYPVGSFSPATIVVEEAEGTESGFTRPVDGPSNIEYLEIVEPAAAEDTLLAVLTGG